MRPGGPPPCPPPPPSRGLCAKAPWRGEASSPGAGRWSGGSVHRGARPGPRNSRVPTRPASAARSAVLRSAAPAEGRGGQRDTATALDAPPRALRPPCPKSSPHESRPGGEQRGTVELGSRCWEAWVCPLRTRLEVASSWGCKGEIHIGSAQG